jgi:hypothetical protein
VPDHGVEQILLGAEVMVERAFGYPQAIQHVLDGHLLVALGIYQALGHVQNLVAPDGKLFGSTWHRVFLERLNRPPV